MSVNVKEEMSLNNFQLGILFALYAAPNIFMPFIVSLVANSEASLWPAILTLVSTIAVGGWMSYFAVKYSWFWLLLTGRLTFGYVHGFFSMWAFITSNAVAKCILLPSWCYLPWCYVLRHIPKA
jgi:hypothetical protein